MHDMVSVIMAGGAGTRFWPVSTQARPKQFLKLVGDTSLLQESYARVRDLTGPDRTLVFTHADYVTQVREQLPELPPAHVIGEPSRRDTAAVNALAALMVKEKFGNAVMAILTADHWIRPLSSFQEAVRKAVQGAAEASCLYTMGIRPTYPATCYGYLHVQDGRKVERFVEKPDLATAKGYVESGQYLWNSGMFFWQADTILAQFEQHLPAHLETLRPALGGELAAAFERLQRISVDYAILEKAPDVRCLAPDFDWTDLGGWLALEPFLEELEDNHHRGRLAALEATSNIVFCEDPAELVALLGVENLIVVRTGKTTLVLHREKTEQVKKLLERIPPEAQ